VHIIRHILRNSHFVIIVTLLLSIWGIASFFTIPRSEDPQLEFSGAAIFAVLPGAGPQDIEEQVVNPIEEELNKLGDIDELTSSSAENVALINIKFTANTVPADKFQEVVTAVGNIRNRLPAGLSRLDIKKYSASDVAIFQYALMAPHLSYRALNDHAKALKKKLQRISGVERVEILACPEQQVNVEIVPEKLEAAGVSLDGIAKMLAASNIPVPGGAVIADNRRFSVKVNSEFTSLDDIAQTIVGAWGTQSIRLGDIARVTLADADTLYRARYNGERAIFLTVAQKKGTNIFPVARAVEKTVTDYCASNDPGLRIEKAFDQSKSVDRRLNGFFRNLLQGMGLVCLVMLLALGVRAAAIIITVIPLSILTAIGVLDVSGFGLDQISIVALAIALGMLVDNGIVVVELVGRRKREGMNAETAAASSITEIGWAIVNSTLTTVIAFLPLAFLNSYTGEFIKGLPLTVIFALSASLLFALTLTPLMAGAMLPSAGVEKRSFTQRLLYGVADGRYRTFLTFSLKHPKTILLIAVLFFGMSLSLVRYCKVSLFPGAEKPQLFISIETPKGSAISRVDSVAATIEHILARHQEVVSYATNIGKSNPRVYYNMSSLWESPNIGQVMATLSSGREAFIAGMIDTLRRECEAIPAVKIHIQELSQGLPIDAPVAMRLTGDNLDSLRKAAFEVQRMIEQTDGSVNIRNPAADTRTDLRVDVLRDKATLAGITPAAVALELRTAVLGRVATTYRDADGDEYPVVLFRGHAAQQRMETVEQVTVPSLSGENVPVRQVGTFSFEQNPSTIDHYHLEREFTVLADVKYGFNTAQVTSAVRKMMQEHHFPEGVSWRVAGEEESRNESFGGILVALAVALVGIFAVLVLQFRNFRQPFIVFTAIPFAISGSILALVITGYSFSFTAFVGFTSLMGIVVNNSIVLIDCANQLRAGEKSLIDTVIGACTQRFTPILLTTVTTMLGLLPLLLSGSSLWAPLSWVIFGGLAVSTLLTLFIVPVLYIMYSKK